MPLRCTTESAEHSIFTDADDTEVIERPWKTRVLESMTDVTNLLDCLEAWHIADREVFPLPDGNYAVAWREIVEEHAG